MFLKCGLYVCTNVKKSLMQINTLSNTKIYMQPNNYQYTVNIVIENTFFLLSYC